MQTVNSQARTDAAALRGQLLHSIQDLAARAPTILDPKHQRHGPKRTDRVAGPGGQRQQVLLQLAIAGVALVQAALDDDPVVERLSTEIGAAQRQLNARKRLGTGWLDTRMVMRPQPVREVDPDTGHVTHRMQRVAFGPYVYFRWMEGGKKRSLYLGRHDSTEGWKEKLEEVGADIDALNLDAWLAEHAPTAGLPATPEDQSEPGTPSDQAAPPATPSDPAPLPVATAVPDWPPSGSMDESPPITPVRAPEVRPHVQALNALVMTLVRKESIGKREGMQLLDQMQAMLRTYQRDNRRRAIFEELDRPHADAADLAAAMHTITAVLPADPRVRTWQAIIDEYTIRFAHGPVRKEAERDTLTQAARALADAAIVQTLLGDDLIPYLEGQDIDPAPWLDAPVNQ
jgi:hypothetical protein